MKIVDKLIRDKISEILDNNRKKYEKKIVSGDRLKVYVKKKIQEEVDELLDSEEIGEVGDILEILKKFCKIKGYSWDEVEKERLRKLEERGGFDEGIILTKLGE